jgi:hypothetical protein
MVGSGGTGPYTVNGRLAHFKKMSKMIKKYKVIDGRNRWRNDPTCKVMHDSEKKFVVDKLETDDQGNTVHRFIILNPQTFQEERIVDKKEAALLILKNNNIKLEEVK